MLTKENKVYTKEELLLQVELMRKTIEVQHNTINRLMDTYVLKTNTPKRPKPERNITK